MVVGMVADRRRGPVPGRAVAARFRPVAPFTGAILAALALGRPCNRPRAPRGWPPAVIARLPARVVTLPGEKTLEGKMP